MQSGLGFPKRRLATVGDRLGIPKLGSEVKDKNELSIVGCLDLYFKDRKNDIRVPRGQAHLFAGSKRSFQPI